VLKLVNLVNVLNRRFIRLLYVDSRQSLVYTLLVIIFPIQLDSGYEYLVVIYYDQQLYTELNLLCNNFSYLLMLFS
jgi:hypothetical protein